MSAPPVVSYHPKEISLAQCMGRLTEPDKRWSPHVCYGIQCSKEPRIGDLCTMCAKRAAKGTDSSKSGWNGRVNDDDLSSLPSDSHVAGSDWFFKKLANGLFTFNGQRMALDPPQETIEVESLDLPESREVKVVLEDPEQSDPITDLRDRIATLEGELSAQAASFQDRVLELERRLETSRKIAEMCVQRLHEQRDAILGVLGITQ